MLPPLVSTLDTRIAHPSPKITDPFYLTPEWRKLSAEIIAERGRRCQDPQCKTPDREFPVIYPDHIHEIRDGGAKFDRANILLRCPSCHTLKTNRERAKRTADTV
jgi:5-methylcytosine-specific restriction endonuclease McrA